MTSNCGKKQSGPIVSNPQHLVAVKLRMQGFTYDQIAERTKVTKTTVCRWFQRPDVTLLVQQMERAMAQSVQKIGQAAVLRVVNALAGMVESDDVDSEHRIEAARLVCERFHVEAQPGDNQVPLLPHPAVPGDEPGRFDPSQLPEVPAQLFEEGD